MSSSYTVAQTFTATHAKHIAAKVAADLLRINRFYGVPSLAWIANYEAEVIELLKSGFLGTVTYGFKRNDQWIVPTLRYTAKELVNEGTDDDPGKVVPNADVSNASFYSYLTYSTAWSNMTGTQQEAFKQLLPFQRTGAAEPGIQGYLVEDRSYSSGGRALSRYSIRNF